MENRDKILDRKKAATLDLREWYVSLKEGRPCADCGGTFHHTAMHWDHLPGNGKVAPLSALVRFNNRSAILSEIEKCELVCANCHAVRTFERRTCNGA